MKYKRIKLYWYYHDLSDSIFPDEENKEHDGETSIIGEYVTGTVKKFALY
jgi:hypothetical protein